jgi:hypothetical protein
MYDTFPGDKKSGVAYRRHSDLTDATNTSPAAEMAYINNFKNTYKYARDFTSYVERPVKGGGTVASSRGSWLDYFYSPQVIGTVYAGVLYNKNPDSEPFDGSFMYGAVDSDQDKCTSYATVHEAVARVLEVPEMIAMSFDEAINYVWRPICTESQFYLGIMDCISIEMYNAISLEKFPEDGGPNLPSNDDPYPNFDSDAYVPTRRYFQYSTWKNFWNACNTEQKPGAKKDETIGKDLAEYSMPFNEDRTMDFSRQGGKCFDIGGYMGVSDYITELKTLPFGSDQM